MSKLNINFTVVTKVAIQVISVKDHTVVAVMRWQYFLLLLRLSRLWFYKQL